MAGYEGLVVYNYRLIRQLGDGGFGVVYLAEHVELGRKSAVKILHPEYARRQEVVDRFFREARAACDVGHPAIVDITNFGRLESGEPFFLMDFVDGRSLAKMLEHGPLPLDALPDVFDPVAAALAAAHKKGIVHRDLKPDNIMVVEADGAITGVKLLDFGIAKLMGEGQTATRTGSAMGTPNYMAPEQARDAKNVDARADVYGLGATIFAALVGRPPFTAANTVDLLIQVTTQPAPRVRTLRPEIPGEVEVAVARCLEKDPNARPGTIEAAWGEVARGLGHEPVVARRATRRSTPVPAVRVSASQTTLSAAGGEVGAAAAPPAARSSAKVKGIVAAVVVAGLTVGGLLWWHGRAGEKPAGAGTAAGPAAPAPPAVDEPAPAPAPAPAPTPAVVPLPEVPVVAAPAPPDAGLAVPTECDPVTIEKSVSEASSRKRVRAAKAALERLAECDKRGFGHQGLERRFKKLVADGDAPAVAPVVVATPPPPPPPPSTSCSEDSFASVYRAQRPSTSSVEAALARLQKCKNEGKVAPDRYKSIQSALMSKLM